MDAQKYLFATFNVYGSFMTIRELNVKSTFNSWRLFHTKFRFSLRRPPPLLSKDLHCLKEVSFKLSTLHWCSIKASIITTTKRKLKISLPLDIFPSQQRHKTLRHSTRGKNDIAWGEIRGKSSKPQNVNQMCVPPLGVTEQRLEGPLLTCKTMCQHLFFLFSLENAFPILFQEKTYVLYHEWIFQVFNQSSERDYSLIEVDFRLYKFISF